jgi:hypothetical protein
MERNRRYDLAPEDSRSTARVHAIRRHQQIGYKRDCEIDEQHRLHSAQYLLAQKPLGLVE